MSTVANAACVTCGAPLTGAYCAQCGEAAHAHDYSIGHFVGELFESLAHVDGRIFTSFRALFIRPGLLASDFLAGRRKLQMGPVQLFLVCNVISFLLQPFSSFAPFTTPLQVHTSGTYWWAGLARSMVAGRVAARGIALTEYTTAFNETAHLQGKTLLMVMVPAFALGLWALYGRARRYYGEHLVVAFYIYAFFLVAMGVSTVAGTKLAVFAIRHGWWTVTPAEAGGWLDNAVTVALIVAMAIYIFMSNRRAYGGGVLPTAAKTAVLVAWMAAVLTGYKFILFFTTFYAT